MSAPDVRTCGAAKKDGTPCGQKLGGSAKECPWHGPSSTPESRSQMARLGGLGKLRTLSVETTELADVFTARGLLRRLQLIEHSVVTGQLAPEVAKAASYTLSIAKGVAELAVHAKIREIEERVAEREHGRLPAARQWPA